VPVVVVMTAASADPLANRWTEPVNLLRLFSWAGG
jgi:hypothetical protein